MKRNIVFSLLIVFLVIISGIILIKNSKDNRVVNPTLVNTSIVTKNTTPGETIVSPKNLLEKVQVFEYLSQSPEMLNKKIIFTKDAQENTQEVVPPSNSTEPRFLFEADKISREGNITAPIFKVFKNGIILYSIRNDYVNPPILYIWLNGKLTELGRYSDYSVSPDGKTIILVENIRKDCYIKNLGIMDTINYQKFYKILTEDKNLTPSLFFEENNNRCVYDGYDRDVIVGWSNEKNYKLLLQEDFSGQLQGYKNNLFELDINNGKKDKRVSMEERTYLDNDTNYNNILTRVEDTACCANINASNDQTFIYNLTNKAETKIFDEYLTYNNKEKAEEHNTENAVFSPGSKYIAQTIKNFFRKCEDCEVYQESPILLVTDLSGKEIYKEDGLKFLGWVDSTDLLVKSGVTYTNSSKEFSFIENSDEIVLVNVLTKERTSILKGDFKDVWILEN